LIELNRGLARPDLPDFEPASRNDVDALGAFLEANWHDRGRSARRILRPLLLRGLFHRPRRHEARSRGVQAAAEATAGGEEVSRRRFTAHSLELHSPLLITGRKQWNGAGDRFPQPQVGFSFLVKGRRPGRRP